MNETVKQTMATMQILWFWVCGVFVDIVYLRIKYWQVYDNVEGKIMIKCFIFYVMKHKYYFIYDNVTIENFDDFCNGNGVWTCILLYDWTQDPEHHLPS